MSRSSFSFMAENFPYFTGRPSSQRIFRILLNIFPSFFLYFFQSFFFCFFFLYALCWGGRKLGEKWNIYFLSIVRWVEMKDGKRRQTIYVIHSFSFRLITAQEGFGWEKNRPETHIEVNKTNPHNLKRVRQIMLSHIVCCFYIHSFIHLE